MRTTIDLPDDLFRTLKVRAGMGGVSFKQVVLELIQNGLHATRVEPPRASRQAPPPVIIPYRGVPIPAVSPQDAAEREESEAGGRQVDKSRTSQAEKATQESKPNVNEKHGADHAGPA